MNKRRGSSGPIPVSHFEAPKRQSQRAPGRRHRLAGLALTIAVALLATAPASPAAVAPGTPLPVAPGVPTQGRAWELVTLPDTFSAFLFQVLALSPEGDRIFYTTVGPLPDSPTGEPQIAPATATRGADGWVNATVPALFPDFEEEPVPVAIAPDFETSLWRNRMPSGEVGLFRRTADGEYTLLVSGLTHLDPPLLLANSTDLGHVVVRSERHLLPADASRTSGASIYELVGSALRLVDVGNDGALISNCGSRGVTPNSISRDGRRIFFSAAPGCGESRRVYLRTDGATTTEISAPQCSLPDCGPEADVTFVGATPNGSGAFLVTAQKLTNDDGDSRADLYGYDVASGTLTLVSTSVGGNDLIPTTEAVHVSADGSHATFGAVEQIGPGETSAPRLYITDGSGQNLVPGAVPSKFLQVSADGRYTVFATPAPVVAGDVDESLDVYRYDSETATVDRISAGSTGENGPFAATIEPYLLGGSFPAYEPTDANLPYRVMSDDGSRVFFTTAEDLLPEDQNDLPDVYEWTVEGLGLVSSGAGDGEWKHEGVDAETIFGTTTPDGRSVLFLTGDTLLPRDRDGGDNDFYVARIGGGFDEPSPPAACSDQCGPSPRGRSDRPLPASAQPAAKSIRVARLDPAARRRIAATGWIELLVEVPKAGRLSAEARARVGRHERTIAAASVKVAEPGPARLRMRLSGGARRVLARGGGLSVRLAVRLSRLDSSRRIGFQLGGGS